VEQQRRGGSIALIATLLGAAFLALYVARLCPDLALVGDSAELVTAAALWGIPHPPGYPLFTAVGHLFAALPLLTLPWRVHLTSAVFHAGAVGATVVSTFCLTRSRVAAVAAGFGLGISRSFLLGSLYAEVFPLNDLLFACALALALLVREAARDRAGPRLLAFAACAGVATGHHMMIALATPALATLVLGPLATFVAGRPRRALALAGLFLAPVVLSYALVPLAAARGPYLSWGAVHDVPSFVRLVTRGDYGGLLSPARHVRAGGGWSRVVASGDLLVRSTGVLLLCGALVGLGDRLRRDPLVGAGLLLAFVVPGPVFAWLNALDTTAEGTLAYFERFTTMSHVPVAVAFGAGVGLVVGRQRAADVAIRAALLAWAAACVFGTRDVDLHEDRGGIAFAHELLLPTPDRSLVLLSGDQPIDAELYVCGVERLCGDRIAFAPGMLALPWKLAEVRARHPDLEIPWTEGPALRRTHLLVAAAVHDRPVYLSPALLEKDPALASLDLTPDHSLLRVGAPTVDAAAVPQGGGRSMSR
jgi:hypothetical protein